jgi:hypothetical protein
MHLPKYFYLFLLPFILAITSCDPGYAVIVKNPSNNNFYLKTSPSIENDIFSAASRDSIAKYKINENLGVHTYEIPANQELVLWSHIGIRPNVKEVPFAFIQLISGNDTLTLKSPQEIVNATRISSRKLFGATYSLTMKSISN